MEDQAFYFLTSCSDSMRSDFQSSSRTELLVESFVSSSPRLRRSFTAFRIMTIAMIIQTIRLEPIAMRTTSKTCMMEDTGCSETVVKLRLSKTSWKGFMAS